MNRSKITITLSSDASLFDLQALNDSLKAFKHIIYDVEVEI